MDDLKTKETLSSNTKKAVSQVVAEASVIINTDYIVTSARQIELDLREAGERLRTEVAILQEDVEHWKKFIVKLEEMLNFVDERDDFIEGKRDLKDMPVGEQMNILEVRTCSS